MMNRGVLERQMFANGGQAVPNEYKGFSKLPEAVQMKMDPVAAKKYAEGGSVNYNEGFPRDPIMDRALALETSREFGLDPREYSQMMRDPEFLAEARSMNMTPEELRRQQIQMMPGQRQGSLQAEADRMGSLQAQADRMGITLRELLALMVSPPFAPSGNMAEPEATMMRPNETYSEVKPMAMGGDPAMAQGVGSMMQMPTDPSQAAPVDPQIVEGLLTDAASEVQDLENVEDYETMINAIRGDELPMEARREELAELVGPEDAAQTPDSVLALAQPAIVMASVDEGIGGLAQAEMTQEVSGPMAGGIMSTVAPPQPAAPGPTGGPPPVNFKEGGLVRRGDNQPVKMMKEGGDPLQTAFESRLPLYEGILGDPTAQLEEQKNLTKANMLFDIANTALAFAAPMEGERPGMSAAERLAMAARTTQLPQTIGARAQSQLDAEKAAKAQQQQMRLSALSAAEADVTAQAKAAADERKAALEAGYRINELMLKQTGDMELAQNQANWKASLQDDQQAATEAIKRLEADQSKEAITLRKKLENQNAIALQLIKGEQALEEIGLRSMNAIAAQDKAHIQALQIQENNQELSRELKDIDVQMKSIDQAIAMEDQKLREADMLQRAAIEANKQVLENKKLALQERKVKVDEAAAGLSKFGTGTDARVTSFLSSPERLAAYAAGTLSPDDTLEMNQVIAFYNAPKSVWSEEKKEYVIVPGNPLSNELMSSIKIRQENGLTIPNIKLDGTKTEDKTETKEEIVSSIMSGIKDPSAAFGTEGSLKSVANTVAEIFFFGAPFKPEKEAIAGAQALNTKFVQVFQRSAELRDSVMQLNLLKDLTPTPSSMFTGPQAAGAKITRLLGMIDEAEDALNTKLNDPDSPLTAKQVTEARGYLTDLAQLRAGYNVFDNAYKRSSNSGSKVDALRKTLGLGG